jgi:hypothetical protein
MTIRLDASYSERGPHRPEALAYGADAKDQGLVFRIMISIEQAALEAARARLPRADWHRLVEELYRRVIAERRDLLRYDELNRFYLVRDGEGAQANDIVVTGAEQRLLALAGEPTM